MDLAAIEKAAKVVPVFMRQEPRQAPQLEITTGCFTCRDHPRPLSPRGNYLTLVAYKEDDDEGDFSTPLFGFTVSINDRSFFEMDRYHWIRYITTGGDGPTSAWTNVEGIEAEPTLFVRLFNGFDGQGVQHKHARVNLSEYIRDGEGDLFVSIFEPHAGRPGFYVDPVEECLRIRQWGMDNINKFVHTANHTFTQRNINYYWPDVAPSRLVQMRAGDAMPTEDLDADVDPEVARERVRRIIRNANNRGPRQMNLRADNTYVRADPNPF